MKKVFGVLFVSLLMCLLSCNNGKSYLGDVTVYEVDIQGLSDKSVYEDGSEAILVDIINKSANGETPYKVSENSCRVYRDNDRYAIEYDDDVYVLEELDDPEIGTCQGSRVVFYYGIGNHLRVKDLP